MLKFSYKTARAVPVNWSLSFCYSAKSCVMDSVNRRAGLQFIKRKDRHHQPTKGQREKQADGPLPWIRWKWSCLSGEHHSVEEHIIDPKRGIWNLCCSFLYSPPPSLIKGGEKISSKVMSNCIGNITWGIDYPDKGLLPNQCVWSKPTSFTGASWAQASVKTEPRPFISKRSNSCRDIIAPVSPDPSL